MAKKIDTLADLTPDGENFNRHTEFGQKLLEDSLRKFGAGRSILVDKDGNIIAGNSTTETAAAIGMEDVIVVPTDGKKLVSACLLDNSVEGQSVLDLFGGSGTTLIAAEQLNRKCYIMELDPHYCDVIIASWEKLTGNKAERITT